MSYDLDFWKYKNGVYLDNQAVYKRCCSNEFVEGLEDLPTDDIEEAVRKEFNDWKENTGLDWENPKANGAFQLFYTGQFVRFDCYGMDGEDMNRLIDVMKKFECPLYDPQVSERFDGK